MDTSGLVEPQQLVEAIRSQTVLVSIALMRNYAVKDVDFIQEKLPSAVDRRPSLSSLWKNQVAKQKGLE